MIKITPEKHREQIEAYGEEYPCYEIYANVLKRVLEGACAVAVPEAFVQSRAKTLSSFAEKCVRRFDRYPDAVNQMTDLCGARVIVQTIDQVKAVRRFIESNFGILERDDKGLHLSEDKFGYRDMHYIVRLRPERCGALGINSEELKIIGDRRAEVQVRTWLQHAWADTLHDRIYKNTLKLSTGIRRQGALLAALMEEGDRNYDLMTYELDGMIANYTAYASKDDVRQEIAVQDLILANEPQPEKKPGLALKLARLLEACGNYDRIVRLLDPYHDLQGANRCELLQILGYALCKKHQGVPGSAEYQHGRNFLKESLSLCERVDQPFVSHLRKQAGMYARVLSRLGWVEGRMLGQEYAARQYLRQAHEREPSNPYYLADMLGFEIYCTRQTDLPATLRVIIREGIKTCRDHAISGIELPYAYFTAGRLSLLLDQPEEALGYYARGIGHYSNGLYFLPSDLLEEEITWLKQLHLGMEPPAKYRWAEDLLNIALRNASARLSTDVSRNVLIITGGAMSMNSETSKRIKPLLETALEIFDGDIISGGTVVGIPGLVASVGSDLAARNKKNFRLVGYIPEQLPHDGPKDSRYDELIICGQDKFSPEQVLHNWKDFLEKKIRFTGVRLLGFGGGPLSAVEYKLALAFGASVAVVIGTGGAADALVNDVMWSVLPNFLPLPEDSMSVRAFVTAPHARPFDENVPKKDGNVLEAMAMAFHENYLAEGGGRLPDNMKPWHELKETFKRANMEQARYAVRILEDFGFSVRKSGSPSIFKDFSEEEINRMAEMEHGRWNVERLRDGWRYGKPRDDDRKLHDKLLPWSHPDLTDDIKKFDRDAARNFPSILAKAGLEIYRR